MKWGGFKPLLADAVVAHLEPIQQKYNEVGATGEAEGQREGKGRDGMGRDGGWMVDGGWCMRLLCAECCPCRVCLPSLVHH